MYMFAYIFSWDQCSVEKEANAFFAARLGKSLQHTAKHCNALKHAATHWNTPVSLPASANHCNALQYTVSRCNTL